MNKAVEQQQLLSSSQQWMRLFYASTTLALVLGVTVVTLGDPGSVLADDGPPRTILINGREVPIDDTGAKGTVRLSTVHERPVPAHLPPSPAPDASPAPNPWWAHDFGLGDQGNQAATGAAAGLGALALLALGAAGWQYRKLRDDLPEVGIMSPSELPPLGASDPTDLPPRMPYDPPSLHQPPQSKQLEPSQGQTPPQVQSIQPVQPVQPVQPPVETGHSVQPLQTTNNTVDMPAEPSWNPAAPAVTIPEEEDAPEPAGQSVRTNTGTWNWVWESNETSAPPKTEMEPEVEQVPVYKTVAHHDPVYRTDMVPVDETYEETEKTLVDIQEIPHHDFVGTREVTNVEQVGSHMETRQVLVGYRDVAHEVVDGYREETRQVYMGTEEQSVWVPGYEAWSEDGREWIEGHYETRDVPVYDTETRQIPITHTEVVQEPVYDQEQVEVPDYAPVTREIPVYHDWTEYVPIYDDVVVTKHRTVLKPEQVIDHYDDWTEQVQTGTETQVIDKPVSVAIKKVTWSGYWDFTRDPVPAGRVDMLDPLPGPPDGPTGDQLPDSHQLAYIRSLFGLDETGAYDRSTKTAALVATLQQMRNITPDPQVQIGKNTWQALLDFQQWMTNHGGVRKAFDSSNEQDSTWGSLVALRNLLQYYSPDDALLQATSRYWSALDQPGDEDATLWEQLAHLLRAVASADARKKADNMDKSNKYDGKSVAGDWGMPSAGNDLVDVAGYGNRKNYPTKGQVSWHGGIDLQPASFVAAVNAYINGKSKNLPDPVPVYAVADGDITYKYEDGHFGFNAIITHDKGIMSRYAHMIPFWPDDEPKHNDKVKEVITTSQGLSDELRDTLFTYAKKLKGQSQKYPHLLDLMQGKVTHVKKGDVIGFVGTTGHSYGYHLHFAMAEQGTDWWAKKTLDPSDYIKDLKQLPEGDDDAPA